MDLQTVKDTVKADEAKVVAEVKTFFPLQWNTKTKIVTGVVGIILIAILVYAFWPAPKPPVTPQQTINEVKAALEKQYQGQITDKDKQIKDYKSRLTVSEGKYSVLVNKFTDLQKEKENVKPPTSNKETRDRFTALGFAPIPAQ
jgi:hypothetical protein